MEKENYGKYTQDEIHSFIIKTCNRDISIR